MWTTLVCVYGMSAAGVDKKEVKRPAAPINVSHILFYMIIFTDLFLNDTVDQMAPIVYLVYNNTYAYV